MFARGMREFARRCFNLLAALSACLALVVVVGWFYSVGAPAAFCIERCDWDLAQYIEYDTHWMTFDRDELLIYRVNPIAPVGPVISQIDWTYAITEQIPPTAGMPRGVYSLVPIMAALMVLPALWIVWRLRGSSKPAATRRRWSTQVFRICASVSLILVALSVLFCVRSYPYFERFDLKVLPSINAIQVNSSRGSLMLAWTESGPNHTLGGGRFLFVRSTIPPDRGPLWQAAELKGNYEQAIGFTLGSDGTSLLPRNVLIVPYWFAMVATSLAAAILIRQSRKRYRRDLAATVTLCACGYDLRGGQTRCPECGTDVDPKLMLPAAG